MVDQKGCTANARKPDFTVTFLNGYSDLVINEWGLNQLMVPNRPRPLRSHLRCKLYLQSSGKNVSNLMHEQCMRETKQ